MRKREVIVKKKKNIERTIRMEKKESSSQHRQIEKATD